MTPISASPVPSHVRRPVSADLRWHLLDLVRQCRLRLALRDRDIAVLRGLLSLVPEAAAQGQRVVFASNRVLCERCDGIDERTLRRRLARLEDCGLMTRRSSPNGKRYQLRDAHEAAVLSYGLDLSPLFAALPRLEALAAECQTEALRQRALRALIRDWLYRNPFAGSAEIRDAARLSLRRALDADALQQILETLTAIGTVPEPLPLSASDGQNDRHIQNSDKDSEDSKDAEKPANAETMRQSEMTPEECLDLVPSARSLAPGQLHGWADIVALSDALAPALGVSAAPLAEARRHLGPIGTALAVLGLVEAFGRIRNPEAYLVALTRRAKDYCVDAVRMFSSLVGGRRVACIPR